MFAIELLGEDGAGGVLQVLGSAPTYLGRAPQNDLVVLDPTVSGRHLAAWVAEGRVFVEDLGSRNGTHVQGKRIAGVVRVMPGDEVRAGEGTRLRVLRATNNVASGPGVNWTVEDVVAGVRYPVHVDRFRIGGDSKDDLVVAGLPPRVATLLFHANGEIWLGIDDEEHEINAEEPFEVGGRSLVVRAVPAEVSATIERGETRYPYVLSVDLDAAGGPVAVIEDVQGGARHQFTGETRAVLLYVLGRKRLEDEGADVPPEEVGWCDDHDVMVGIWGKGAADSPPSKLNTLVCRVRQELREAGLDPWFVEKRRGATRARATEVRIGAAP